MPARASSRTNPARRVSARRCGVSVRICDPICALIPCQSIQRESRCSKIKASRGLPIDSKFVPMVSGSDVRMAAGFDVRIDADGGRGAHAQARRLRSQQFELRGRLHVEKQNPRAKRFANFLARFADAGKNDSVARHADAPQAVKLPARNDVESAAKRRKHAQDAQIRIGFHRIANRVRKRAERGIHAAIGLLDARAAVQIRGRPEPLRGLRRRKRLRNKVASRDTKTRAYSSPDRQRRRSGKRANGKTRRSLDFHHHQRAIVRDGAPLCEFLHFLEHAVGKFARTQVRVGGQKILYAAGAEKFSFPVGSLRSDRRKRRAGYRRNSGARSIRHRSHRRKCRSEIRKA